MNKNAGGAGVAFALMLVACGTYEWPDRRPAVTPQSFQIHEDALMSVGAADGGAPCPRPMARLKVDDACATTCGPIKVARDGAVFATLLGPEVRRKSSVDPDRIDRPYAKPPVDGSRRELALPQGTFTVTGTCGLTSKATGGKPATQNGNAIGFEVTDGCAQTVEVSCR